ncbi:hypothetical protein JTE88_01765 [Arcanobacterium phocisimile]|uniref:ATP synthase protein I n=1 Tax=Arcanobacterium phocisimile TaxID=1302235 RepID=A0ABX7IHS0_9ACTO|nr:hypothetical protein [Arcanobacterium phocisimile]QRV02507.1 hypothetical protein JTE88_01765 [Arcanobacterium phocisimile]
MFRRNHKPGERRSAQEIILRSIVWNLAATIVIFGAVSIGALLSGYGQLAVSVAYGTGILLALDVVNAVFSFFTFARLNAGVTMVGGYFVKIMIIALAMQIITQLPLCEPRVVIIAMMCGIMLNLLTISVVIIGEDGPSISADV